MTPPSTTRDDTTAAKGSPTGTSSSQDAPQQEKKAPNLTILRWKSRLLPSMRREQIAALDERCEKTGGTRPWFGEGTLITHYAFGFGVHLSLCLRRVDRTTNIEPRTPIGHTCRRCRRLWAKTVKRYLANPDTPHAPCQAKIRRSDHEGTSIETVLVCTTCAKADGSRPDDVEWPCRYASPGIIAEHAGDVDAWEGEKQRRVDWRAAHDAAYAEITGNSPVQVGPGGAYRVRDFTASKKAAKAADKAYPEPDQAPVLWRETHS